jgi:tetratricopeptide (TPR) repeat protein
MAPVRRAVSLGHILGQKGLKAQALLTLGAILERLGRREEAQEAYQQAGQLFGMLQDLRGLTESLIRLGLLKFEYNEQEEALSYLRAALVEARRRADAGQVAAIVTALGKIFLEEGAWASARGLYTEGLELMEAAQNLHGEAKLRTDVAKLDGLERRFADGIAQAQRALLVYQTLRDRSGEAEVRSLLGWLHQGAGDLPSAIEHHRAALALYRALHDRPREAAGLLNLATVYEAQGLLQEVQAYRAEALALLQSLR